MDISLEDVLMANRCEKMYNISVEEVLILTLTRYHFHQLRMCIIKSLLKQQMLEAFAEREPSTLLVGM